MKKTHTELAPATPQCSDWYGYEISDDTGTHGWVAPVMNGRTKKWYFSKTRPVANRPSSVIDMGQFDSSGYSTLKRAIQEMLLTYGVPFKGEAKTSIKGTEE